MTSSKPLVSVITPAYNAEPYLSECVESVRAQTYRHWDYTIIDNGSSDRTLEIANAYASEDPRIRVVHLESTLTQGQSHNFAMRQLSPESEYCKMVFADDKIFPECLARMVEVAERHPTVGLVTAYRLKGDQLMGSGLAHERSFLPGREACRLVLLNGLFIFGSSNTTMIRSAVVHGRDPFFEEAAPHWDSEVCFEILKDWDLGFVPQVLTFDRVGNPGVSTSIEDFETGRLDAFILMKKYGAEFLDPDEYRRSWRASRADYYGFLAESLLRRHSEEFWAYHRAGLAWVGVRLDWRLLAPYLLREVADRALNPKDTLSQLLRGLRG